MIISSNSNSLPEYLTDPNLPCEPIDISIFTTSQLVAQLRLMLLIRKAEEKLGDMVTSGKVRCPVHLGIGQEAVAAGVSIWLRSSDRIFGAHRSHSHFLAAGGSAYQLFAEALGRVTGASKGMGGSMHLHDSAHGFLGSVPIVAASVPIAVGAALAAQLDGRGDIAVSYFGDGAMEEGVLHESMNLAAALKLPIVFVCENNLFSSHLHISLRQPTNATSRFAIAHSIPSFVVDGNNIATVSQAAEQAVTQARLEDGPAFIEAVTYRWRGHVGPREDLDVGVRRNQDLGLWKQRDPIRRVVDALLDTKQLTEDDYVELEGDVSSQIEEAWFKAEQAPFPDESALLDLVYQQTEVVH